MFVFFPAEKPDFGWFNQGFRSVKLIAENLLLPLISLK